MLTKFFNALSMSTKHKVIFIASIFAALAMVLESMFLLESKITNAVRAYVRGEGQWAKAQKKASYFLMLYSYSKDEEAYQNFLEELAIIQGDTIARKSLEQTPPNLELATNGFLQGRNHPIDVNELIWFYIYFNNISYMHDAIEVWKKADEKIIELRAVGASIHQLNDKTQLNLAPIHDLENSLPSPTMKELRHKAEELNLELNLLENEFSEVLGEGARWVKSTLEKLGLAVLSVFMLIALFVTSQVIRSINISEQKLRVSEGRFRRLKESNIIGIVSWKINGEIEEANDNFLKMLGYNRAEFHKGIINRHNIISEKTKRLDIEFFKKLKQDGRCEAFEKIYIHKNGSEVPVLIGAALVDEKNCDEGIAFVLDLTNQKKAEEQTQLNATVFSSSHDGIIIMDEKMCIISANAAFVKMTGYAENELIGTMPLIFKSTYTPPEKYRDILQGLYEKNRWEGELIDRIKDGSLLPIRVSVSGVKDSLNKISHYVAIISDISVRKAQENILRHIAQHDILTGLPNRALFNDRAEQLIKHAKRHNTIFALIFIDLDKFKPVNDMYGHLVGDQLLQLVAQRLSLGLRSTDTISRLGGDEFVILLSDIENRESANQTLNKTLNTLVEPCVIEEHDIEISVSAGLSIFPEDGDTLEALIAHADQAMYAMKNGTNSK